MQARNIMILALMLYVGIAYATAPTTTFSSFQNPNTSDQNITLTCTPNTSYCAYLNYKIDSGNWINSTFDTNINNYDATVYSSSPGTDVWALAKTININAAIPVTNKTFLVTATVKASDTSGASGQVIYYYTDGTNQSYALYGGANSNYNVLTFTNSNSAKDLNQVKISYGCGQPGVSGCSGRVINEKDINVNYTDTNILNPSNFKYSGSGIHTIDYNSTNAISQVEATNHSTFTTYGNGHFQFYDQNSGLALNGVTVTSTLGDNNTLTGNTFDTNFQSLSGTSTVTYAFNLTGHSTRYYQADLTQFTDFNVAFGLAPSVQTSLVPFQIYKTDTITTFANTYIELKDSDTNYTIGKLKTDSTGAVTFDVRTLDQNYSILINNGQYTYNAVALSVYKPIDELTLLPIGYPYQISITQNFYALYQNLTTTKIVYLMPDTKLPYNIQISDMNGIYFPRTYAQIFPGNPITATLQPYLISDINGLVTTIHTVSSYTNQPVPNILIKVYKYISGGTTPGLTFVEQDVTDSKGEALSVFLIGGQYQFQIYYANTLLRTDTISITAANIYIKIPDIAYHNPVYGGLMIDVNYSPNYGQLLKTDTSATQTVTLTDSNSGVIVQNIFFQIIQDNNLLAQTIIPYSTSPVTNTFVIDPTNGTIGGIAYDTSKPILVKETIQTNDGNYTNNITYAPYTGSSILENFGFGARTYFTCSTDSSLPCTSLVFLSIVIALFATIAIATSTGFMSLKSVAVIFLLIMGLFTYLSWFPATIFILMCMATGGFYMVRGWIR